MSLLRCATLWLAVAALSTAGDVDDLKKSDELTTVPLYTYRDEAYAADVLVGTPPQKVRLAFRSSSEDTVVAAKLCSACCKHELFDSTTSSTYQATGETWKSHHQRLIYYSSDVLQAFGETKNNFSFFLTVFSNGTDDFADQPFDGHFNSLLLLDKKGFPKHFTFYARRTCANGVTVPTKTTAGVITVGGKDETNCDKELVSVPSVYSDLRYTLTLDAYKVGGKTHSDGWNGVLSSKATELIVPKKDFDKISTAFGATAQADGSYTVDCTKTPGDLTLTFNGVDLKVPFAQLARQVDNVCTLLIKPRGVGHSANDPSEWSLGLPFAREYCQIFAKGGSRVSFAKHKVVTDPKCTYEKTVSATAKCPAGAPLPPFKAPATSAPTTTTTPSLTSTTPSSIVTTTKGASGRLSGAAGLAATFVVFSLVH